MATSNDEVIRLLIEIKESLERDMAAVRDDMAQLRHDMERLGERFDAVGARLDRQGGLIRSGQTNIVRLNDWSEKIDQMLAARDKRMDEIEARLRKLEGNRQ
jgi:hypothetical protein